MSGRLIVLSDLHISPPGPLASFHAGPALAGLLQAHATPDTTLVLTGDALDFLRIERPATLDLPGAPKLFEKLLSGVAAAPWGQGLLAGLAGLLLAGGRCVIVPGSHDVELHNRGCRDVLLAALGLPGHPGLTVHLQDDPWRTEIGKLTVVVGHGSRNDPWNDVDPESVRRAIATGARELKLPPGSRLVTEVLHAFKLAVDPASGRPRFPFVDLLKPEVPAVPLLLWYLDPKLAEARFSKTFGLGVAKLLRPLSRAIGRGPSPSEGNPLLQTTPHVPIGDAAAMAEVFAEALSAELSDDQRRAPHAVIQRAQQWLEDQDGPHGTGDRLAAHGGFRRLAARAFLRQLSKGVPFFDAGALSREDIGLAQPHLPEGSGPRVAIFGHTHAARLYRMDGDRTYINTGTWTDLMELPSLADEAAVSAWIDALDRGEVKRVQRLTYAEVTANGARLATWGAGSAAV
jgi:UDP-2,3-diacylglucosamine pyrophosphatase LpxH